MKIRQAWPLLLLLAAGCSGYVEQQRDADIGPEQLLSGEVLGLSELPAVPPPSGMLRLSNPMREFLVRNVEPDASERARLEQLVDALIENSGFGLDYTTDTLNASQAFALQRGNCLSFTNLFIALARELGLRASYQEVDVPPDWTRSGNALVLNRHINVLVKIGVGREQIIDFNIADFRSSYARRPISDQRALAHYYNNLGAEQLLAGDTAAAFALLRSALRGHDLAFAPAWDNLGSLYRRAGLLDHAEAAYRQALLAQHWDLVAMSNLLWIYEQQGREAAADRLRERVRLHRMRNPYYRYQLAREAFANGQYELARGHLRYALRRKPEEGEFQALLAQVTGEHRPGHIRGQ